MWPLSIFLFVATAAPQQKPLDVFQDFHHLKLPVIQRSQVDDPIGRKLAEKNRNTCLYDAQLFLPPPGWSSACPCRHDNMHACQRLAAKTSIARTKCEISSAGRNAQRSITNHPLAGCRFRAGQHGSHCILGEFSYSINIGSVL